jgi:hypothetical protein
VFDRLGLGDLLHLLPGAEDEHEGGVDGEDVGM